MQHILGNLLNNIGYIEKSDEYDLIKCLRQEAARWACILDVPECKSNATDSLLSYFHNLEEHK